MRMFWRWLMTGSAALLAFVGAALLDCTYSFIAFVDAFDVCIEADLGLPGGSVALGIVLVIGAIALVAYQWIPLVSWASARPGAKARARPTVTRRG